MTFASRLVAVVRRLDAVFLLLLVGVYVFSAVCPAPAAIVTPIAGVRTGQLVLAVLLFIAGLRTVLPRDANAVLQRGLVIGTGVIGRLMPLAIMLACVQSLAAIGASPTTCDIVNGLTFVAAMPAANTSTAWTRRSSGDLTVCVGVVLATTLLSPVVIPAALALLGRATAAPVVEDTFANLGFGVIGWVVVPTVAGILVGRAGGLKADKPLNAYGATTALAALLLLNYLNASQALPSVLQGSGLAALGWALCGAAALVPLCYATGILAGRRVTTAPAQRAALAYAVGMSNTGLAGTLVAVTFPDRPVTLYPIVICTLVQHVTAVLVHERELAGQGPVVSHASAGPARRGTSRGARLVGPRR